MTKKTAQIRMARTSEEEMNNMLDFFQNLENIMNNEDVNGDFVFYPDQETRLAAHMHESWDFLEASWQRFYWGFNALLNSITDPNKTYLDYHPKLKQQEKDAHTTTLIKQCIEDADESMTDGELLDAIYEILPGKS